MTPSESQFSFPRDGAMEVRRIKSSFHFPKVLLLLSLVLLFGISASTNRTIPKGDVPPELKTVVDGNTTFALDLYKRVNKEAGNLFLSPYSISSALGMTYAAAKGNTESQIAQALRFATPQKDFHDAMSIVRRELDRIKKNGDVQLNVANALWVQKNYELLPTYSELVKANYGANLNSADFIAKPDSARQDMSTWVQQETKNKIKGFFAPGAMSPNTRLVVLNAIYFKSDWASRFKKRDTKGEVFWAKGTAATEKPMMCQKQVFPYFATDDVQLLTMPYKGCDLSMVVLLPVKRDGLAALEQHLSAGILTEWLTKSELRTVDVRFPKFTINSRYSLASVLSTMGMTDAFDINRADFTAMTSNKPLFINSVEHAALVEVNEEGTVAAAATGVTFGCAANIPPPPAVFHADHPFIFLIRENHTGTLLFIGRVNDPS